MIKGILVAINILNIFPARKSPCRDHFGQGQTDKVCSLDGRSSWKSESYGCHEFAKSKEVKLHLDNGSQARKNPDAENCIFAKNPRFADDGSTLQK
jgi:hypothetical protein